MSYYSSSPTKPRPKIATWRSATPAAKSTPATNLDQSSADAIFEVKILTFEFARWIQCRNLTKTQQLLMLWKYRTLKLHHSNYKPVLVNLVLYDKVPIVRNFLHMRMSSITGKFIQQAFPISYPKIQRKLKRRKKRFTRVAGFEPTPSRHRELLKNPFHSFRLLLQRQRLRFLRPNPTERNLVSLRLQQRLPEQR